MFYHFKFFENILFLHKISSALGPLPLHAFKELYVRFSPTCFELLFDPGWMRYLCFLAKNWSYPIVVSQKKIISGWCKIFRKEKYGYLSNCCSKTGLKGTKLEIKQDDITVSLTQKQDDIILKFFKFFFLLL